MGETSDNCQPFSIITSRNDSPVKIQDGAVSDNGKVWGTYIHGIFDNDEFRTDFLNEIRSKKGLPLQKKISFRDKKDENIKTLADVVRNNIDIKKIYDIAGLAKRC
ncbi:MAG TPA: hypothetical protein DD641_03375 [Deltaproteobacteria bacterium]|nr:hypothetical protein [Deltaproteobacteria bacterium]